MPDMHINALHGASTPEQADRELKKFFPIEQTIALIKPGVSREQKGNFIFMKNQSETELKMVKLFIIYLHFVTQPKIFVLMSGKIKRQKKAL